MHVTSRKEAEALLCLNYITYAKDYRYSAQQFLTEPRHEKYSPIPYDSYCIAIELCLKGYLLSAGSTKQELKKIGHNLCKLLQKAEDVAKSEIVKKEDRDLIQVAKEMYRSVNSPHQPSYVYCDMSHLGYDIGRDYLLNLPSLKHLDRLTETLICFTESSIKEDSIEK